MQAAMVMAQNLRNVGLIAVSAPFAEAIRYGGELQPLRLASWWIWTVSLIWIASLIRRARLHPARIFLMLIWLILGVGLVVRGLDLAMMASQGLPHKFPLKVGLLSSALGFAALLVVWWMAMNRTKPILFVPIPAPPDDSVRSTQ
jgi:hypothetical protein